MSEHTPHSTEPPADTSGPESPRTPSANTSFFGWLRSLDIPRLPGWIGGVCAGIAARLGIDPLIVRGIFLVVAVLGGPAIFLYAVCWFLLPDSRDRIHLEELVRGRIDTPIIGIGALLVLSFLPISQGFWFIGDGYWGPWNWPFDFGGGVWSLIVIGLVVWFVVWLIRRSGTTNGAPRSTAPDNSTTPTPATYLSEPALQTRPAPTAPAAPQSGAPDEQVAAWREQQAQWKADHDAYRASQEAQKQANTRAAQEAAKAARAQRREVELEKLARTRPHPLFSFVVVGAALIAGGLTTLAMYNGTFTTPDLIAGLGAALGVLALGIIINGVRGKRAGGASFFAVTTLVVIVPLALVSIFPSQSSLRIFEDARFAPVNQPGSDYLEYTIGAGSTELDLSRFYSTTSQDAEEIATIDSVSIQQGFGEITVIIPEDHFVTVNASVRAGDVDTRSLDGGLIESYGGGISSTYGPDNPGAQANTENTLTIDLQLGAGTITIIEPTQGDTE